MIVIITTIECTVFPNLNCQPINEKFIYFNIFLS